MFRAQSNLAYADYAADLDVRTATSSDDRRWDEYVANHPEATLFHFAGWGRLVQHTFAYRSFSCYAQRGARITGILPLFLVPTFPFGSALVSTPLAVYGGICMDDGETGDLLLRHAQRVADDMGVRYVELRHRLPMCDLPVKPLYVTFRKKLSEDPTKNFAAIPRKQRRMIRQGEQHGLTSEVGGEEWLDDFYHVYAHSVRNLGTPVYPRALFTSLLREFGTACRILVVFHGGKVVAGVMTFLFRDQVLPYYGGALRQALPYAVNDFMYWRLMGYAADRGYRLFDFGRSKIDSGSYHFKRHWGFEPEPLAYEYHLVKQARLPDNSPRNPKFQAAIALWKCLPIGVTRWLGPKVVRFFP